MKRNNDKKCDQARSSIQQKWDSQQIDAQPAPDNHLSEPFLTANTAHQKMLMLTSHNLSHWKTSNPIGIKFRDSSKKINNSYLESEHPKCPSWNRARVLPRPLACWAHAHGAICGNKDKEKREQANQIVMVLVCRHVEQKNINATDRKQRSCCPIQHSAHHAET